MNPRVTAIVAGLIMIGLGIFGLAYPDAVMGFVGFAESNVSRRAAAYGEVRAVYGGLFLVMGVFTAVAAMDVAANRSRLLFVGLLWLGMAGGRLFSVFADGNPGLLSWGGLLFEVVMGSALCIASQSPVDHVAVTPPPLSTYEESNPYVATAPPAPPVPPV